MHYRTPGSHGTVLTSIVQYTYVYKETYGRAKEIRANGGGENLVPYGTVPYGTVPVPYPIKMLARSTVRENSLKD